MSVAQENLIALLGLAVGIAMFARGLAVALRGRWWPR